MKRLLIGLTLLSSISTFANDSTINISPDSMEGREIIQSLQEETDRAITDKEDSVVLKQIRQGTGLPRSAVCTGEHSLKNIQKNELENTQQIQIVTNVEQICKDGSLTVMKTNKIISSNYTLALNGRLLKKVETVSTEVSDGFLYNTKEVFSQIFDGALSTSWGIVTADNDGKGKVQTITTFK